VLTKTGRRQLRRRIFALCGGAAVLGASPAARADSCVKPDLIETIPPDDATDVPSNASLFARYQTNAQYVNEPVTMDQVHAGVTVAQGVAVPATFDATEGLLQVTPPAPLTPGDSYVVHWPSLRGIDTATLGASSDLHFTAGSTVDTSPPTFAGLSSVSWDVSRDSDSCDGQVEERYVFHLGLGAAADDGGRDGLTLVVFETTGPDVDSSAPLPVLVQRIPAEGDGVTISRTDLVGHVCFAAIVKDLTSKVSTSGDPVCVDTVAPPFFYGCTTTPGQKSCDPWAAALLAAIAVARRARPPRRAVRRCEGAG
jgi:hypothetical protein